MPSQHLKRTPYELAACVSGQPRQDHHTQDGRRCPEDPPHIFKNGNRGKAVCCKRLVFNVPHAPNLAKIFAAVCLTKGLSPARFWPAENGATWVPTQTEYAYNWWPPLLPLGVRSHLPQSFPFGRANWRHSRPRKKPRRLR